MRKPRLVCAEPACARRTFISATDQVAVAGWLPPLGLRTALLAAVIDSGRAVAEVAVDFGVAWWTVQATLNAAAVLLPALDDFMSAGSASMSTATDGCAGSATSGCWRRVSRDVDDRERRHHLSGDVDPAWANRRLTRVRQRLVRVGSCSVIAFLSGSTAAAVRSPSGSPTAPDCCCAATRPSPCGLVRGSRRCSPATTPPTSFRGLGRQGAAPAAAERSNRRAGPAREDDLGLLRVGRRHGGDLAAVGHHRGLVACHRGPHRASGQQRSHRGREYRHQADQTHRPGISKSSPLPSQCGLS